MRLGAALWSDIGVHGEADIDPTEALEVLEMTKPGPSLGVSAGEAR